MVVNSHILNCRFYCSIIFQTSLNAPVSLPLFHLRPNDIFSKPHEFYNFEEKCLDRVENACKMVKCWHRLQRAGTTLERPPKYDEEARDLPPTLLTASGSSQVAI